MVSIPYMRVTNSKSFEGTDYLKEFQSPICGSQTFFRSYLIIFASVFQSPICGSQTYSAFSVLSRLKSFNPLYAGHKLCFRGRIRPASRVSIPYMRVTNLSRLMPAFWHICGFNPLYAGHKPRLHPSMYPYIHCFNPLYAGHKLGGLFCFCKINTCFNPLYAGHKRLLDVYIGRRDMVSIPYMRVTNDCPHARVFPS